MFTLKRNFKKKKCGKQECKRQNELESGRKFFVHNVDSLHVGKHRLIWQLKRTAAQVYRTSSTTALVAVKQQVGHTIHTITRI